MASDKLKTAEKHAAITAGGMQTIVADVADVADLTGDFGVMNVTDK